MRIVLLLLFICIDFTSFAQPIKYNIPEGLEKNISQDDYKKLVDVAVSIVKTRYKIEHVEGGTIHLAKGQDMIAFNLDNLILKCVALKEKSQWNDLIDDHFQKIFSTKDEEKKINPSDFENIKKYLSLRIYRKESLAEKGGIENLVARTDLEGTYTLLMLDLPGAFRSVPKEFFLLWKKDSSEVFRIAQSNINRQEIEKVTRKFNIDGSSIEISFLGNENYAASYALDLLNNSPEMVGEWGSVVCLPNKGLVDICKVSKTNPVDFVKFIQGTKPMIEKSYREHPQPISDEYFWYYKGTFTKITVLVDANGRLSVISPFGLTELMTNSK